jgi:hypothetical protein
MIWIAEAQLNIGIGLADTLDDKVFPGQPTNGVQPVLSFYKSPGDWEFLIEFRASTGFPITTWFKTTNRVGSRLQLWLKDGAEVYSTNRDVMNAFRLPVNTTLDVLKSGVPRSARALQWLHLDSRGPHGAPIIDHSADVFLSRAFGISSTNEMVLQITPLLYRVDTNLQNAHLTEFAPIRVRLLPSGVAREEQTGK